MGIMLLTDGLPSKKVYIEQDGHSLFTFPYSRDDKTAQTKLVIYNMGRFFEITSSDQLESVQFDSYFDVLKVNASVFKKTLDEGERATE